jgi:Methyltransferase domain
VHWLERFPPTDVPWTQEYVDRHRGLVGAALDDEQVGAALRHDMPLPSSYGIGFDERVVELPWLLAHPLHGRMLDAGSALNHEHVLERLLPRVDSLHVVTLAPEERAFTELGVSYVYSDLRELPYRTGYFEAVACISTLEHVGMDNRSYGSDLPRAADPEHEVGLALAELRRVLASHGVLFLTVPYGASGDHGWFRQFDRQEVEALRDVHGLRLEAMSVFRYRAAGWERSSLDEAADASYRDYLRSPVPVADRAAAARAVACMRFASSR